MGDLIPGSRAELDQRLTEVYAQFFSEVDPVSSDALLLALRAAYLFGINHAAEIAWLGGHGAAAESIAHARKLLSSDD